MNDAWTVAQLPVRLSLIGCLAAASVGGLPGATGPLRPPSELKHMSVEELLSQKVHSVTRMPEELGEVPGSIYLIRGDAARYSGATALSELLRLAPNLFVAQASAYDWAVGARGFVRADSRVNKMQVLIDGRTVYSPLFSGVFWDTQDVFLPDLDRIEVISGPAGVTWGANAVNGVINVTTKSSRDTQGVVAYAGIGTELESNLGVRYGGTIGQDDSFRVYFKRRSFDDTLAAGMPGGDAWDFTQTGFRIDSGWSPSDLEWTLQGDAYRGRYKNPEGQDATNEGANLLARWLMHYSDVSDVTLRVYQDYTMRRVPGTIWEHLRTTDVDFQHHWRLWAGHQLVWGGNYRFMNEDVHVAVDDFVFLPEAKNLHVGGLFIQDIFDLVPDRWRLTAGLRVENNTYSGWGLHPDVRLAWMFNPEHTLWAGASRATRTPSRVDADFFLPKDPPYVVAGGPGFDSEELLAYEVGWRGQLGTGMAASVTAYFHDYDRLRSVELGNPITLGNGLKGQSVGLEGFLDWQVSDIWRLRVGGFLLDQDTSLKPGATDAEGALGEASVPKYQFLARSGIDLASNLMLWLSLRNIGSVPVYDNGVDAGAIPAYTELDASLRWQLRPGLECVLAGRNLLHDSHPEIGESAATRREIERSVHAMIRWDF